MLIDWETMAESQQKRMISGYLAKKDGKNA